MNMTLALKPLLSANSAPQSAHAFSFSRGKVSETMGQEGIFCGWVFLVLSFKKEQG